MRKLISGFVIVAFLILTIAMNVSYSNSGSNGNVQLALDPGSQSVQLQDSELLFEGGARWICILLAGLGMTASIAGMLTSAATGGVTFWISFAGYNISKASLIECFL